jgi:hypothetical protein
MDGNGEEEPTAPLGQNPLVWSGLAGRSGSVEEAYQRVLADYGEELLRLFAWRSQQTVHSVPQLAESYGAEVKALQQIEHATPAEIARRLHWGEYPY